MANCAEYVGYPQETFVPAAVREEGKGCDCDTLDGANGWRCKGDLSYDGEPFSDKFVAAPLYKNIGMEGHGAKNFEKCAWGFGNLAACNTE